MLGIYEMRKELHMIPEIANKEFETTELLMKNVQEAIDKYDVNAKIIKPINTGFIVEYKVNDGEFYLFRADIDGLATKEETGWEFASTNGCMHACGHDVHMSTLYGFILHVFEKKIDKNILFVFQPAEEGGGGAELMIKTEIFNYYKINSCYAIHVSDEFELGSVASTTGVLFASARELDVDLKGKAAHVALPYNGNNALNALRAFMDSVDKIPVNPAMPFLFGVGMIQSGKVRNIIPDTASLRGSIRAMSVEQSEKVYRDMRNILEGIKNSMGVDYELNTHCFYPEVSVDKNLFEKYSKILSDKFEVIDCGFKMTGEDFGFFSKLYPSIMFWLGTRTGEIYGLHNSKFLPPNEAIDKGIELFKTIIETV